MPTLEKDQKRYLYNGRELTVTEIANEMGIDRKKVYNRIATILKNEPLARKRELSERLASARQVGAFDYPVARGETLRLNEIVERYRVPEAVTKRRLHRGQTLSEVLLYLHRKETPPELTVVSQQRLVSAFHHLRSAYQNRLPDHWMNNKHGLFSVIGYPKESTDFLWVTPGDFQLEITDVYWAPVQRRSEYMKLHDNVGRPATTFVSYKGQRCSVKDLADEAGIPYAALMWRIKKGWPEDQWLWPLDKNKQSAGLSKRKIPETA